MALNHINNLFNHKTKNVVAAAALLAAAGLASRLLGFARNALLAYFYGAGDVLDAYFLAFRLPDFFFNLFLFGAFSAGFVPVFIRLKNQNKEQAWRLAGDVLNITFVVFSVFGVLFFWLAPWLLKYIAPGFGPDKLALAVKLSRIMFLQPVFLGLSVVFSGILQANHKFLSYALAPIFYNIGIIFGILVLVPKLGPVGLAWGVVLGALMHMLVQYPAARASGFRYRPVFSFRMAGLKGIFSIVVPRSGSLILNQLNLVIMAALASFLGTGRVAVFNLANDLNGLILGVVAIPLGIAVFPALSQAVSKDHSADFAEILLKTARQLLFVMIPSVILFLILRAQIVRLTLGYGKFDWADTILTIQTLAFFLVGLIFQGILTLLLRAFFAQEDARTPFWVLFCGILVSLGASLALAPWLDVPALALALSLGAIFNAAVLGYILQKRASLKISRLGRPVCVFIIGSLAAGLAAYGSLYVMAGFLDTHRVLHLIIQFAAAALAGAVAYLAVNAWFETEEWIEIKAKFGLKKAILPDQLGEEVIK